MPCVMGCFCSGKGAPGAGGGEDEGARVGFLLENPLAHFDVSRGMETEWGGGT